MDIPEGEIFAESSSVFLTERKGERGFYVDRRSAKRASSVIRMVRALAGEISARVANERKEKKARAKARHNQLVRFLVTAPARVQEQAKAISFEELIMKCFEAGNVVSARQSLQPVKSLQRKQISRIIYNS